jgi:hypothetical protein
MKNGDAQYDALWPRGRRPIENHPPARRPDTLNDQTIGELWDGLFRGNEIFPILREKLSQRYPGLKFVPWTDFPRDGDHGFPDWNVHPDLLSEKGCDMVIVGTGA